ncbi:amidohydrolase family protein [Nocardia sp. NPDC056000]|uniref:amidohydrolase family protein n=1 Tax=Nocardia sp. NPDC056000 TaxID=3345674 RepID=UPI0035E17E8D
MPNDNAAHSIGFIDVHAHYLTDSYLRRARAAGHELPDGMPEWPTWSAEAHVAVMDRSGIATAMLSLSSPGVHFGDDRQARALAREINEEGAQAVRDHPGRFGLFASLPLPDIDGSLTELAHAFDVLHADGVILMTNAHGVYLGDSRLEPVFAELDRRNATVLLHPTSPVCWEHTALGRPRPMLEFLFDTTRTVTDLVWAGIVERYPRVRFIVPHCGAALPVIADRVNGFRLLLGDPTSPDVVDQLRSLYYDTAGTAFPRHLEALLRLVDPSQLLYGSDYPWTPAPIAELHTAAFTAIPGPSPAQSWLNLTTTNASRLFPRLANPESPRAERFS